MKLFSAIFVFMMLAGLLSCEKENTPPQASFSIIPGEGNNETTFTFDGTGSSDLQDASENLMVIWDWEGDDFFDTQYAVNKTAIHLFSEPGEYMVTMVVKDSRGLTDTLRQSLTVTDANNPPASPANPTPENEAGELSVNLYLSWECVDPDGDYLMFTVYFGTNASPELYLNNYPQNSFDPGKLEYGTTYYWKIKARDSKGSSVEGPIWEFTTIDLNFSTMTDPRDNKTYSTIEIGSNWWMAENLNFETDGSYCYSDLISNCFSYGSLYTWEAALTACPDGWHLPSKSEFESLVNFLGGSGIAGGKLKDYEAGLWRSPNTGANNTSGFGALPAGMRYGDSNYSGQKYYAQFFSSTEFDEGEAFSLMLAYDYSKTYIYNYKKNYAVSVRCLKD